jgi:O-antigen ligase
MYNRFPVLDSWFTWLTRNRAHWLPPLVVASVALLSIGLSVVNLRRAGYFGLPLALLVLAMIVGVVGVILFLRWRQLGFIILIPAALLAPLEIGTGSGSSLNAAILLVVLLLGLWILDLVTGRERLDPISHLELPLIIFLAVSILSFIVGQLPWFPFASQQAPLPAQLGGLAIFVLSAGAFLLAGRRIREMPWLQGMTWAFIVTGTLFVVGRLLPTIGPSITRLFQHGTYNNSMFWTWLAALALGQALFNQKLGYGWRMALGGAVALTLYVGYFINGDWVSGWFPPLVAVAVIVAVRSRIILVAAVLVAVMFVPELLSNVIASDEYSYSTRIDAWLLVLEMIKTSPVLGFGPANYYWYTPLFPIRGYSVVFNSHNQYVDILAQTGALGMLFLLWFFVGMGRLTWALRDSEDGFARGYIYGVLGGLAGTLVAGTLVDWFLPFVYNIGMNGFRASILPWLFLGGLMSLARMSATRAAVQ